MVRFLGQTVAVTAVKSRPDPEFRVQFLFSAHGDGGMWAAGLRHLHQFCWRPLEATLVTSPHETLPATGSSVWAGGRVGACGVLKNVRVNMRKVGDERRKARDALSRAG